MGERERKKNGQEEGGDARGHGPRSAAFSGGTCQKQYKDEKRRLDLDITHSGK